MDSRHIGPEGNLDSVQTQIREMRLANPDGVSASTSYTRPILPAPWPISSYVMLRTELERLDRLVTSKYPSGTLGLPSPSEMLMYVHKDACRAVKHEMRRQDRTHSVTSWDLFLEGKTPEEFTALQMLHWDTDSDVNKAVSYCAQYSEKILVLRAASESVREAWEQIRVQYTDLLSPNRVALVGITPVLGAAPSSSMEGGIDCGSITDNNMQPPATYSVPVGTKAPLPSTSTDFFRIGKEVDVPKDGTLSSSNLNRAFCASNCDVKENTAMRVPTANGPKDVDDGESVPELWVGAAYDEVAEDAPGYVKPFNYLKWYVEQLTLLCK